MKTKKEYLERVEELEAEGLCTSDAQAVADAEEMQANKAQAIIDSLSLGEIASYLDLDNLSGFEAYEFAHESADSTPYVIYTHKARKLVEDATSEEVSNAEFNLDGMGYDLPDYAAYKPELLAYQIIHTRLMDEWHEDQETIIEALNGQGFEDLADEISNL